MKKIFTLLFIAAAMLAATSCEWTIGDSKFQTEPVTVSASMLTGKTFAQQPYGGTSWGDTTYEIVKFEEGRVVLALGSLDDYRVRYSGTWSVAADGKTIIIDGLQIFDHMSGNRYFITEAQVGAMKSGRLSLFLAYNVDGDTVYDPAFVYEEMN